MTLALAVELVAAIRLSTGPPRHSSDRRHRTVSLLRLPTLRRADHGMKSRRSQLTTAARHHSQVILGKVVPEGSLLRQL